MRQSLEMRAGLLLILISSGCGSPATFSDSPASSEEVSLGSPAPAVLKAFQPALAVRATGCLMCHAVVKSQIITDFGAGSSYFGGASLTNLRSPYGDDSTNWHTAHVEGKVLVPKNTAMQAGRFATLAGYLRNAISDDISAGRAQVTEVSAIRIAAPTVSQITAKANFAGNRTDYQAADGRKFSGRVSASSSIVIEGGIHCDGDLFIDGVAHLKNVTVETVNGCRIYATRSIFVSGKIGFSGSSASRNVQLASARAVFFGMGTCGAQSSVRERFQHRPHVSFPTRSGVTVAQMVDDAAQVPGLKDVSCSGDAVGTSFERILVTAPQVHSRYSGKFKGTVIAEIALFRLGDLEFEYDPVFSTVPVLPKLNLDDLLRITP